MGTPFLLKLNVSVSLSTGKTAVHIHNISERVGDALPDITSLFPHQHDYDFYVGAWMGDTNPHMQFELLKGQTNGTGRAKLSVPILPADTDTLKLGVFVKDPETRMMRHISSGFQGLDWVGEAIDGVASRRRAQPADGRRFVILFLQKKLICYAIQNDREGCRCLCLQIHDE